MMDQSQPGSACGSSSSAEQEEMDQRVRENLDRVRHTLMVMSGKGGVGKSTISLYLALGLAARGYRVGLLDVDLHGPSLARMLGIRDRAQVDNQARLIAPVVVEHGLKVLSLEMLMPDRETSVIWRGPLKGSVIKQFLSDVEWGALDYLVIDCPPGTGDEVLSLGQLADQARAVVVTSPQEIALADVRKSLDFCRQMEIPILGLVENMSGLTCPHCGQEIELMGSGGGRRLADRFKLRFLATLPWDPRLVAAGDAGRPLDCESEASGACPKVKEMVDAVVANTA